MKTPRQIQGVGCMVFKQKGFHQFYSRWSKIEDKALCQAVASFGLQWSIVSQHVPGRTPAQCSARWLNALNPHILKGRWSRSEDEALVAAIQEQGVQGDDEPINWARVAQAIPRRTGIQCQARWSEALDPSVRKGRWLKDEDERLGEAVEQFGGCWNKVAGRVGSRTQRQCRTRWHQIMQSPSPKKTTLAITESLPSLPFHSATQWDVPTISLPQPFESFLTLDPDLPSLSIADPFWGYAPQ